MVNKKNLIKQIKYFSSLCSKEIDIKCIYLFGSFAQDKATNFSDIDIAVVSNSFKGKRFLDRRKLYKFILQTNSAFEIHPYRIEDFTEDDPFVKRILESGIRIV